MANYNKKKKSVGRIIAGVLCGVLVVAAVAGSGTALYMGAKNNGWFDKEDEVEEEFEEGSIDNVEINEGVSTAKLSISSSRPSASLTAYGGGTSTGDSYTTADSYVLTAVYNEDATDPKFIWSSTDTAGAITLTPSDDTLTCTVTCNSAFSSQITITCTAEEDTTLTASCTVDYVKRIDTSKSASLFLLDDYTGKATTFTSGKSSVLTVPYDNYSSSYASSKYFTNKITCDGGGPSVGTGTKSETYDFTSVTWSYCGYSGTFYSDTSSYTALSYGTLLAAKATYLGYGSGLSDISWMADSTSRSWVYLYMAKDYYEGVGVDISLTFKGDSTGDTATFNFTLLLDVSELFVSVSSVNLNNSAIYF